jgi:hypothetical protein
MIAPVPRLPVLQMRELPRWVRDLIAAPPATGCGLHQWIYRVACVLKPWRSDADIVALLTAMTAGCGRDARREIQEAVAHARSDWQPGRGGPSGGSAFLTVTPAQKTWPARDLEAIAAVAEGGSGLADLREESPQRLDEAAPDAEELTDLLFPGDPLLCVAGEPESARTLPRSQWRGRLAQHSLIVPSPMTARTGRRQDGRPSHRCLDNTGARRFLVVEFDFKAADASGTPTPEAPLLARLAAERRSVTDLCASLLLHLSTVAPLLLAVHSGGKSLHGWFPAAGVPESTLASFFRHAVRLGADPATWTRCQLIRLPEGRRRDNGRRQRLWFLDPAGIRAHLS